MTKMKQFKHKCTKRSFRIPSIFLITLIALPVLWFSVEATAQTNSSPRGPVTSEEGAEAHYQRAMTYGREGRHEDAFREFATAAEKGHAAAQYSLGQLYWLGVGTEPSAEEAIRWYEKAAKQQNENAYYALGVAHHKGKGAEKDIEAAGNMYGYAARLNSKAAKRLLEEHLAYCRSGIATSRKTDATAADYPKVLESCILVAASGEVETQFILGVLYLQGEMVDANPAVSRNWFYAAAAQGHVAAQYQMAVAYLKGVNDEGPADKGIAYAWLCVLQKQANTPGSPGLEEWRNLGIADEVWSLKAELDGEAAKSALAGRLMEDLCDGYIAEFYKPKRASIEGDQ